MQFFKSKWGILTIIVIILILFNPSPSSFEKYAKFNYGNDAYGVSSARTSYFLVFSFYTAHRLRGYGSIEKEYKCIGILNNYFKIAERDVDYSDPLNHSN